jgi:large subunit ribosomal protein L31
MMKQNIHPQTYQVIFYDVNSGFKFLSRSTKTSSETMEWEDGKTYPVIKVEVSSDTHPFYTGRQKFNEKGGRVEQFKKRYNM